MVFAYAWGNVIQLCIIEHTKRGGVTYDGYFLYSDQHPQTCTSLFFLSESILIAVFDKREVKVLYTAKFIPGRYVEESYERSGSIYSN